MQAATFGSRKNTKSHCVQTSLAGSELFRSLNSSFPPHFGQKEYSIRLDHQERLLALFRILPQVLPSGRSFSVAHSKPRVMSER